MDDGRDEMTEAERKTRGEDRTNDDEEGFYIQVFA